MLCTINYKVVTVTAVFEKTFSNTPNLKVSFAYNSFCYIKYSTNKYQCMTYHQYFGGFPKKLCRFYHRLRLLKRNLLPLVSVRKAAVVWTPFYSKLNFGRNEYRAASYSVESTKSTTYL